VYVHSVCVCPWGDGDTEGGGTPLPENNIDTVIVCLHAVLYTFLFLAM